MTLTARVNGPPRLTGLGLIIVCSYRGGNDNAEPRAFRTPFFWRIFNLVTFLQLRRFIAAMRDHFANPRDLNYQLGMVDAIVAGGHFSGVEIIADARLKAMDATPATPAGHGIGYRYLDVGVFNALQKFDTVVLIYPDALGLTWSALERGAYSNSSNVIIANGRRRLFAWDRRTARSLALRRFLANTRLVELIWGILVVPTAAVLAAVDFARGRT
jgi:hypothetical protein